MASLEELAPEDIPSVEEMVQLMPKRRRSFPMPRRMLRLLAGGVKLSVLATVLGHLLRCPHYSKTQGWNPVGACKASWVAAAFGVSERSVKRARAHLIEELGWLFAEGAEQWYLNRFGGRFGVQMDWNPSTPSSMGEGSAQQFSTSEMSPPFGGSAPDLSPPESEQPSPLEIQKSTPGALCPRPRNESSTKKGGGAVPKLSKVTLQDLKSVPRVMELFDLALENRVWRAKGWTPTDNEPERLNWAAAARRAHVRGGPNPCGLFVHLVSSRKWAHISNDDEDAVRLEVARWRHPELEVADEPRGEREGTYKPRVLSARAKKLRLVRFRLERAGKTLNQEELEAALTHHAGWTSVQVREAESELEAWKAS